jgi:hypothetical protein
MKIAKGIICIFMIFLIACTGCIDSITGEMQKEKAIVDQVRPLIQNNPSHSNPNDLLLRGKALIWDMTTNSRSPAYDMIPGELRAISSDKIITVFMISGARSEKVGTYSISGKTAYRNYTEIFVLYWPENKTAGLYSIVSEEPRSNRPVQQSEEFGDPNKPIAEWIAHSKKQITS